MKRFNKVLALTLMVWGIMSSNASALVTIDTVLVGNAGNANDTTGFGAVNYEYSISKGEVTLSQYCGFLNAVGATDTYGLYNTLMATTPNIAGITRSGVSGGYTYSVIGSGSRPVTYVSWYDAARFVNWLQNGQPTGAQAAGTTETGAYTLVGNTGIINRNADWTYGLPSENEWYKAAYYDKSLNSGSGGYWLYPTRSNTQPNSRNGSPTDANSANYYYNDSIANGYNGGYAVNNSTTAPTGNALTDDGAYSSAASFYGTFDQGGNVWEWNDAVLSSGTRRGERGGAWNSQANSLAASGQNSAGPATEANNLGFRIVEIPEPSMMGFMALAMAMLAWQRKRAH